MVLPYHICNFCDQCDIHPQPGWRKNALTSLRYLRQSTIYTRLLPKRLGKRCSTYMFLSLINVALWKIKPTLRYLVLIKRVLSRIPVFMQLSVVSPTFLAHARHWTLFGSVWPDLVIFRSFTHWLFAGERCHSWSKGQLFLPQRPHQGFQWGHSSKSNWLWRLWLLFPRTMGSVGTQGRS